MLAHHWPICSSLPDFTLRLPATSQLALIKETKGNEMHQKEHCSQSHHPSPTHPYLWCTPQKKKRNTEDCAVRESDRQRGLCNSRGEAWSQGGNNLTATMERWGAELLSDALSFTFPTALKDSSVFMMMSSLHKHWISHNNHLRQPHA